MHGKIWACIAAIFLLALRCAAQTPAAVPITSEQHHHLALQNEYVRLFEVEVPPHQSTLLHQHDYDYIYIAIGDAQFTNILPGEAPAALKMADGDIHFSRGGFAHLARNDANTPFRNVTIEFLQDEKNRSSSAKWDEDRGLHNLHGGTEEILFVKDGVRASEVELQTAGVDPEHRSAGPQLIVAVTDLVLRSDFAGKGSSNLEMKSGDVKWFARGLTHSVTNVGRQGARYVVVEFQ